MSCYLWVHVLQGYDRIIFFNSIEDAYKALRSINLMENDVVVHQTLDAVINALQDQEIINVSQGPSLQMAIGVGDSLPENEKQMYCKNGYFILTASNYDDPELMDMPPLFCH